MQPNIFTVSVMLLISLTTMALQYLPAASVSAAAPPANKYAEEITVYNWDGDIPESVLAAFTRETKVRINYLVFNSQEEAIANIRAGNPYDVAVIDGRFISLLAKEGLLTRLNYENLQNFKYISPNFRGLAYDPDNHFSIPYSWGTTGLLVNTGIEDVPVRRWADLWDLRYAGKVAISVSYPREAMGMTLKSLGYSANSEHPAEIETALARLLELQLNPSFLYRYYPEFGLATMKSGKVLIAVGFSGDLLESQKNGLSVAYILPEEGLLLWADTFIVPKSSRHQATAELFINFLLRPEISADIVNQKYYASANEAARPFVLPQILANRAIYPTDEMLMKAEIFEALSPAGQHLLDAAWRKFLAAYPKPE
jgi:spermidine/putrescine transport system substrate-binding protein